MKFLMTALIALLPLSAQAGIDFINKSDWPVGGGQNVILETVGIHNNIAGEQSVMLNFEGGKQIRLSGPEAPIGLALTTFQGKCIRVMPGLRWETIALILTCN